MRLVSRFSQGLFAPRGAVRRCLALALASGAFLVSATAFQTATAQAGVLEIQFTGLNLVYDGTSIYDAGASNTTSSGNPAQADQLTSMNFYLDGNLLGVLNTDVYADIYIANVLNIPVGGGAVTSAGNGNNFGVDLLTSSIAPAWGLALNIDSMIFFYTGSKIAISVSGIASELVTQSLPFGVEFDPMQPITIVMSSANLTNVTSAGGYLTGFNAAGTGNVAGTGFEPIPEPSTLALAGLGVIGLVARVARRRKK